MDSHRLIELANPRILKSSDMNIFISVVYPRGLRIRLVLSRVFSVLRFHCFKHDRCNWTRGSPFGAALWRNILLNIKESTMSPSAPVAENKDLRICLNPR